MIRYADEAMLLEDRHGVVAQFLNRHLTIDDLRWCGLLPGRQIDSGSAVLVPQFSNALPIRFNELHVVTGATRYSYMLCIVDRETIEKLAEKTENGKISAILEVGDIDSVDRERIGYEVDMYALPPRPITPRFNGLFDVESIESIAKQKDFLDHGLWILPLVDMRWYWQWIHAGEVSAKTWTTYTDAITDLQTLLNCTIDVSVLDDDTSLFPASILSASNDYRSAASLLESLILELQFRLVPNRYMAGTAPEYDFELQSPESALFRHDWTLRENQLTRTDLALVAGDKFADVHAVAAKPVQYATVFADGDGAIVKTTDANVDPFDADKEIATHPTWIKTVWSSCTSADGELQTWADLRVNRIRKWESLRYDHSYAGHPYYHINGYEYEITFSNARACAIGRDLNQENETWRAVLRVKTFPDDWAWILKRSGGNEILDGVVNCKLGDGVYRVELATLTVTQSDTETACNVTVDEPCIEWNLCPDPLADCPTFPRLSLAGIGKYVYAYDVSSFPLDDGYAVTIGRSSSGQTEPEPPAEGEDDPGPRLSVEYRILRANVPVVCLDHVTAWKCEVDCDGNLTGNIVADRVKRYVLEAHACDECTVNVLVCPE